MLAFGKLSKQQMAHGQGGDNIGFEFSGFEVRLLLHSCQATTWSSYCVSNAHKHSTQHALAYHVPAACMQLRLRRVP